ncbi:MAG TPA: hypothetical protein P5239_12330, partial [Victivallales bacterium]|nr:hypothetical protein [Victivallales bacterium]
SISNIPKYINSWVYIHNLFKELEAISMTLSNPYSLPSCKVNSIQEFGNNCIPPKISFDVLYSIPNL